MSTAHFDAFETRPARSSWRNLALVAGAAAALMAAVGLRATLVRYAPRTAALFELVGLPINLVGLDIARVSARIVTDGDRRVLVVDGDVANPTTESHAIPPMQVSVRGGDGQPLYVWTAKPPRQNIAPGERAAFSARLATPPVDGADVVVEFDRAQKAAPAKQPKPTARAPYGSRTESQ